MRMRAGACTDTGRVRANNEDAYACDPRLGLFIVCDGMGGEAAGEVASRMAVETIESELNGASKNAEDSSSGESKRFSSRTRRLEAALKIGNHAIYQESQKDSRHAGMGSTVVSAWIADNVASVAHVGDSRAYLWRGRRLDQLTRDHSLVEEKVRLGLLSREESLEAEDRNVLVRALGREPQVEVDLAEVPLMEGDYLVLCTDGLTQMVSDDTVAEAISKLREPQKISDHLVNLANRNGGVDNTTVVVVKVGGDNFWQRFWGAWRR